jgi:hypothetical protein
MTMAAMVADHDIALAQPGEYSNRVRLLAYVCVRGAIEQPARKEVEYGLFKTSYLQHSTIESGIVWAAHRVLGPPATKGTSISPQ